MSEADLVSDLRASLNNSASMFTAAADADFKRHLKAAALAFCAKRSRTLVGSVTLVADQPEYDVPADFAGFKSSLWGIAPIRAAHPWERAYPGRLPDVRYVETDAEKKIYLDPPPSGAQISALGAEFRFYYFGAHAIGAAAADTTILPGERGKLLLRAQAEAMRELAMRNVTKPVQMREGIGGMTRNGTPTYLFELLMREFEAA